jgi:NTP pyrophosphatase (non-canonical NTP hydrolase)
MKNMTPITISEMMELSEKLYKLHENDWMKKTPESNIYWVGWLVGEIGEVIDIIKKKGVDKIMNDKSTRHEMLKEITDCYMYLADILNRYEFTDEEFSEVYRDKMKFNLNRDYSKGKTKSDKLRTDN